jgi:hypothetical protein
VKYDPTRIDYLERSIKRWEAAQAILLCIVMPLVVLGMFVWLAVRIVEGIWAT